MSKMTQPSTLNQTFDTSLIDVQRSFSSTETDTSGSSSKENAPPVTQSRRREPSPYKMVPTDVLYAEWANTYDTDGNVLQAADDIQMHALLPELVKQIISTRDPTQSNETVLKILDLGCGTGRNTVKLLATDWKGPVDVVGWDSSRAMLEIAKSKCDAVLDDDKKNVGIELEQVDISSIEIIPARFSSVFDGLVSTLVLEHVQLDTYFGIISLVVKARGYALITGMHPDLGAVSSAGYKTASGERFKTTVYVYAIEEIVAAAKKVGFEVVGSVREMAVDERMFEDGMVNGAKVWKGQVAERARKYIGTKIWCGMMLRKL